MAQSVRNTVLLGRVHDDDEGSARRLVLRSLNTRKITVIIRIGFLGSTIL